MLHVFDMDGTLLRNTTASLEISRHLECLSDITNLENQFEQSILSTQQFAQEVFKLWSTLLDSDVEHVFDNSPWIQDIHKVLSDIKKKGEHSIVITMSPNFFANKLKKFGFNQVYSSIFPTLPFSNPIDVSRILTPHDKVKITQKVLKDLGLNKTECIAYGDSGSDIPLFQYIQKNIAINGTESLTHLAKVKYTGNNLFDAYQLSRSNFIDGVNI
ncbi:HAD-IB family phosphatase [Acinetobacter baumannii]|nr:HAD-IB family phosphatase [Acinetobacter baumannii]